MCLGTHEGQPTSGTLMKEQHGGVERDGKSWIMEDLESLEG